MYGSEEILNSTNIDDLIDETADNTEVGHIIYLFWIAICIVPNCLLIYVLCQNGIGKSYFNTFVVNWSLANIFQMIPAIFYTAIPGRHISMFAHTMFSGIELLTVPIPVMFATLFMFDKFLNSKKFCRAAMYNIWIPYVVNIIITIVCTIYGFHNRFISLIALGVLETIAFIVLVTKFVIFAIRSSDEINYPLRLAMSSICIVSNYVYAIYWITTDLFLHYEIPNLHYTLTVLIYADGIVNLLLLLNYEPNVCAKFQRLFRSGETELNIKYRSKNGDTEVDAASSEGSSHKINIERPE